MLANQSTNESNSATARLPPSLVFWRIYWQPESPWFYLLLYSLATYQSRTMNSVSESLFETCERSNTVENNDENSSIRFYHPTLEYSREKQWTFPFLILLRAHLIACHLRSNLTIHRKALFFIISKASLRCKTAYREVVSEIAIITRICQNFVRFKPPMATSLLVFRSISLIASLLIRSVLNVWLAPL